MPLATGTFGGRDFGKLLTSDDLDLDGVTSTTNTTVSSESIYVPEGWVGIFVVDYDVVTTTTGTISVQVSFDGGTGWGQMYWTRDDSAPVEATMPTAAGQQMLKFINPFPDIPTKSAVTAAGAGAGVLFRLDFETDGTDSDYEYGDCFYSVAPRVQGALLETVRSV